MKGLGYLNTMTIATNNNQIQHVLMDYFDCTVHHFSLSEIQTFHSSTGSLSV